jgi:BON domain
VSGVSELARRSRQLERSTEAGRHVVTQTYTPDSGTKDKNYDLITVTQLCLEHVWRLEQYALDAERAGDDELASLFRRMQDHSRRGAEASKRLLQRRMAENGRRYDSGSLRGYGRPAYAIERGPYAVGYGYEARTTSYGYPRSGWGQSLSGEEAERFETLTGRFAGRGPKGYTRSRERIVEAVSDRLTDHPDLDASEIQVDVKDDVVVLRGKVHDRGQKRLAEDIAESVSGVRDVRNELDVDKGMLEELTDKITGRSEEPTTRRTTRPRAGV